MSDKEKLIWRNDDWQEWAYRCKNLRDLYELASIKPTCDEVCLDAALAPVVTALRQQADIDKDFIEQYRRELDTVTKERDEAIKIIMWTLEYIDAIPEDVVLPTMPGFDRDYVNCFVEIATKDSGEDK